MKYFKKLNMSSPGAFFAKSQMKNPIGNKKKLNYLKQTFKFSRKVLLLNAPSAEIR